MIFTATAKATIGAPRVISAAGGSVSTVARMIVAGITDDPAWCAGMIEQTERRMFRGDRHFQLAAPWGGCWTIEWSSDATA